MTTEASTRFQGEPNDSSLPTFLAVGNKTYSGFTHNKNVEPVSFHPDYAHSGDHPGMKTPPPPALPLHHTYPINTQPPHTVSGYSNLITTFF